MKREKKKNEIFSLYHSISLGRVQYRFKQVQLFSDIALTCRRAIKLIKKPFANHSEYKSSKISATVPFHEHLSMVSASLSVLFTVINEEHNSK